MSTASEGKGLIAMWKELSALRKALYGAAALGALLAGAAAATLGPGDTLRAESPPTLAGRVTALELRAARDSARHAQLYEALRAGLESMREQNTRIICFLEEQRTPTGRSCLK